MYVCMYVRMYVCMYVCVYIYIYIYIYERDAFDAARPAPPVYEVEAITPETYRIRIVSVIY